MIKQECKKFINELGENESIRRGFIELFENMSEDANIRYLPAATLVLQCYDASSGLQSGDWAPEIHLVIRKVVYENEQETKRSILQIES